MNLSFERFLGTSGQNVCDIQRYSSMDSHLEILEETLQLRHLAPTAPDTLGGWVRRKESLLLGLCGLKLFFCFRLLPFLSERSIYFGGMSACLLQRQRSDLWVQTHQRSVRDALTVWNTSTQGGGGSLSSSVRVSYQVLMVKRFFWWRFQSSAALKQPVWSTYALFSVSQSASPLFLLTKMKKMRWISATNLWTIWFTSESTNWDKTHYCSSTGVIDYCFVNRSDRTLSFFL